MYDNLNTFNRGAYTGNFSDCNFTIMLTMYELTILYKFLSKSILKH